MFGTSSVKVCTKLIDEGNKLTLAEQMGQNHEYSETQKKDMSSPASTQKVHDTIKRVHRINHRNNDVHTGDRSRTIQFPRKRTNVLAVVMIHTPKGLPILLWIKHVVFVPKIIILLSVVNKSKVIVSVKNMVMQVHRRVILISMLKPLVPTITAIKLSCLIHWVPN